MTDLVPIRISVASMRQPFHGCEPEYIRDVCHGRCCDAPTRPTGTLITIHSSEEAAIRARGGVIDKGLLVTPDRRCVFKTDDHLCSLHVTPDKPFGCIASPFTLNGSDMLIVRNRYRMLPCYGRKGTPEHDSYQPAYRAFRPSIELIFGEPLSTVLTSLLGEYNLPASLPFHMPERSYEMLRANDETKRTAAHEVVAGSSAVDG